MSQESPHGGELIASVLAQHGVQALFTLCGGHISPILTGAKAHGIRVVDVRNEVTAVFAADAAARMTGTVGVAAVTAGPGVTNTVTAIKNAQMAQSPLLLLGGATATVLKGRGSLQDIDQLAVMRPIVKWATSCKTVATLAATIERAIATATDGVPGPVFVEVPVDLLYPESVVRDNYMKDAAVENATGLLAMALKLYLRGHLYRKFRASPIPLQLPGISTARRPQSQRRAPSSRVREVARRLRNCERPVLVIGSQALARCTTPETVADAVQSLGIPTFLAGMARGLLGRESAIQFRHKRSAALKEADLVIVAGFPFDFRLGYGRSIGPGATLVAANLSAAELHRNRRPDIAVQAHAGEFLRDLADNAGPDLGPWEAWKDELRKRENARDAEIAARGSNGSGKLVNPLSFFLHLEEKMADDAILVVDGGDFVATGAYILRPRAPLRWLDPGVFGTLGVGGGFAVGAAVCKPKSELWLLYGDGSSAYSLAEFDTFARHGLAPIAVIGTDGAWAQIAREQVEMLGDDIGTVLARTAYHDVAKGYGGEGLLLTDPSQIDATLDEAKRISQSGKPVCINVHIEATDFRKGSISL